MKYGESLAAAAALLFVQTLAALFATAKPALSFDDDFACCTTEQEEDGCPDPYYQVCVPDTYCLVSQGKKCEVVGNGRCRLGDLCST